MSSHEDDLYRQLAEAGVDDTSASDAFRDRVVNASLNALSETPAKPEVRLDPDVPTDPADDARPRAPGLEDDPRRHRVRRSLVMAWQRSTVRWLAAAAAVALVVFGGYAVFSPSRHVQMQNGAWWLAPPAAWAQEIDTALEAASVNGITCRERVLHRDGRPVGDTVITFYMSRDSYRRDVYDLDALREVQWYIPDGDGMIQTGYRLDTRTCGSIRHEGSFGDRDPVQRLRSMVQRVIDTGRCLGTETIEGHECVGFEAARSAREDLAQRVWFHIGTKLPVRTEFEFRFTGADPGQEPVVMVSDEYDFDPHLPPDTFTPVIPEGFINTHPDELRQDDAANEESE